MKPRISTYHRIHAQRLGPQMTRIIEESSARGFKRRCYELTNKLGWSIAALAVHLGYCNLTVRRAYRGTHPASKELLKRLARLEEEVAQRERGKGEPGPVVSLPVEPLETNAVVATTEDYRERSNAIMLRHKLTVKALADACGQCVDSIWRYRRGTKPITRRAWERLLAAEQNLSTRKNKKATAA